MKKHNLALSIFQFSHFCIHFIILFKKFSCLLQRLPANQLPTLEDWQSGVASSGSHFAPDPWERNPGSCTAEERRIQALGKQWVKPPKFYVILSNTIYLHNVHLDSVAGHLTFDSSVAGSNFLICHKIEGGGVLHKWSLPFLIGF